MKASTKPFAGRDYIQVTDHALTRARSRFRNDNMEREAIREGVREAIESGNVYTKKPPAFTLYKQKPKELPRHQRVVVAPDKSRAWIVALDKPGQVVVVTSLSRAWGEVAA